jgi:hypothetical protein
MKKRCLLISFDFTKPEYPNISYAVSSILAQFKDSSIIDIESYSFNLKEYSNIPQREIEEKIKREFQEKYLRTINVFSFIALSAYTWSGNLVNELIKIIRPIFEGKIILGGYEINALIKNNRLIEIYPNVDFYIKGYAEVALHKIFKKEVGQGSIVDEKIDSNIVSPYLSRVLSLNTDIKKIYWETKRGCP